MCQALFTKEVASSGNPTEMTNFRKLLLTNVQLEFENVIAGRVDVDEMKKEIEECEDVRYLSISCYCSRFLTLFNYRYLGNHEK